MMRDAMMCFWLSLLSDRTRSGVRTPQDMTKNEDGFRGISKDLPSKQFEIDPSKRDPSN